VLISWPRPSLDECPSQPPNSHWDGVWCAHAQLRPGVGANGEGVSAAAAVEDLREALSGLIAEFGAPDELTLILDVA
jgi:hypothetical protein